MKEILIVKSSATTYNAKSGGGTCANITEIGSLDEGAISVIDEAGNIVNSATPSVSTDKVQFCIGRASGNGTKLSTPIDRLTLSYEKTAYRAPVAQKGALGKTDTVASGLSLNLPSSLTEDTVAGIVIEDKTKPYYDNTRRERIEYVVKSGDTAADVVLGLVANINNQSNIVTAAAVSDGAGSYDGILLTGVTAGNGFTFAPNGILEDADVVYGARTEAGLNNGTAAEINGTYYSASTSTTLASVAGTATLSSRANDIGSGTYSQVKELYDMCTAEDGNTDVYRPIGVWTLPSPLETSATYTIYTLRWVNERENTHHNASEPMNITAYICVPSTNTNIITAMDTILAGI